MEKITLRELAKLLNCDYRGEELAVVNSVASLDEANELDLTFFADTKFKNKLSKTRAGIVIISDNAKNLFTGNVLISKDPKSDFMKVVNLLDLIPYASEQGIHQSATIHPSVKVGKNVRIGPNVVIEQGVIINDYAQVGANVFIGQNSSIGQSTKIWSNVTVYFNCQIGSGCTISSGAVIGSEGFGNHLSNNKWHSIPHIGQVILGNDVDIGALTAIDRGALDNTVISNGVKIDNLCHIGHNTFIGENTAIAGCATIAGSVKIGSFCMIGGHTVFNGHIEICDKAVITGASVVMRSITEPGIYSSCIPAKKNMEWKKQTALHYKLPSINRKIKSLEKELIALKKQIEK